MQVRIPIIGHESGRVDPGFDADGLDYMHARYYSGSMGRFLSLDPKVRRTSMMHSGRWNRYAYALDSPMIYTDPDGLDVIYGHPADKKFFEKAAKRNQRVKAVLDAFAPGTGRDLIIERGDPGTHPGSGTKLHALTTTYEREANSQELRDAYDAAVAQGGDQAGTAAAEAFMNEGKQVREATIILGAGVTAHEKLQELGHVEQSLDDPDEAARQAEEAMNAPTDAKYKASESEVYAEDFAEAAKKKQPNPP